MRGNARQITLILKQYKMLQSELENIEIIYSQYSKNILKPVDTTRDYISKTNAFSSNTENMAIYLLDYKESITKLKLQIDIINNSLKCLDEREKKIINLKYFENNSWREVSNSIELCDKWCKEIKREAFKKLIRTIPVEVFPSIFFD